MNMLHTGYPEGCNEGPVIMQGANWVPRGYNEGPSIAQAPNRVPSVYRECTMVVMITIELYNQKNIMFMK